MASHFPLVALGKFIRHRKEFILIDDTSTYKRCRVQMYAKGVVLRDIVSGAEVKTKKQQICRADDFLVAEIDAKVGGFGIVPNNLDGAVVSSHYFLFEIDQSRLDKSYLGYYIRTPEFQDQVTAKGSTNYAAIRPQNVLEYLIPLPPLDEQRRIVAQIEALAARIAEAYSLRLGAMVETAAVIGAAWRLIIPYETNGDWLSLRHYVSEIENGWSPDAQKRPATGDEWGVLKVGAVSFGNFNPDQNKALPIGLKPKTDYEVESGDFLMSRANTLGLVGACAIVEVTRPRLMLSDKIFRFKFRPNIQIDKRYLDYVLKSPALRQQIEAGASGTSPTMKNISKAKVMMLQIPPHTFDQQQEIVEYLDGLNVHIQSLKNLHADTAAELDALLPSLLDRAFKGEL